LVGYEDLKSGDYEYPKWSISVGWVLTSSSLVCIPAYMIYFVAKTPGTFKEVNSIKKRPMQQTIILIKLATKEETIILIQ